MSYRNPKNYIQRAINCDLANRFMEAQHYYLEGIEALRERLPEEREVSKKKIYYERMKEYLDRAEQITVRIDKHVKKGKKYKNIPIEDGSVGHDFGTLFGECFTSDLKEFTIEEPYLIEEYHFANLIHLLEVALQNSPQLKFIRIVTKGNLPSNEQDNIFCQIKSDLHDRGIKLVIKFDKNLHDRKIVLCNGYIIKIGRGLHIFKPHTPQFSVGLTDHRFRNLYKTEIDITRVNNFTA